mmetsp:Transcript_107656/g.347468  ORF Transcript_107656/g.347468 Transcript_107656/m.347468 type:complete len:213 (+) Transcript_107656:233-871(+)
MIPGAPGLTMDCTLATCCGGLGCPRSRSPRDRTCASVDRGRKRVETLGASSTGCPAHFFMSWMSGRTRARKACSLFSARRSCERVTRPLASWRAESARPTCPCSCTRFCFSSRALLDMSCWRFVSMSSLRWSISWLMMLRWASAPRLTSSSEALSCSRRASVDWIRCVSLSTQAPSVSLPVSNAWSMGVCWWPWCSPRMRQCEQTGLRQSKQ